MQKIDNGPQLVQAMQEGNNRKARKQETILRELRHLASHLPPGSCLPSENAMAVRFNAARMTVSRAYKRLETENLIERRRGSGSYVKGKRIITFLLPSPGFLSLLGHNEGIARLELEGIRRAAAEHDLEVRTLIYSNINQPGMVNIQQLEKLDTSSLVVVSPWYLDCFRTLCERRCRVAWISTQAIFRGCHRFMQDWFKLEADRRDAMRRIIRLLYQAGCRRIALASPHITGRDRSKNSIYRHRKTEYEDLRLMSIRLPYTRECNSDDAGEMLRAALEKAYQQHRFDGLVLDTPLFLEGRSIHDFCALPESVRIFGINLLPEQCRLEMPFPTAIAPYETLAHDAVEMMLGSSRKGASRKYDYLFLNVNLLSK